ncbi:MAG: hypothetical protein M0Z75_04880 [Nitrospiraceae bacterium]|nr:hypothetical protein [Nitrospiraceae bacterium]MDA8089746.1 hypothetical protein [Nitrospiraceae bacterium]
MESLKTEPFKTCPCCNRVWPKRESFLADKELVLNGYQADFEDPGEGLFIFTHTDKGCGTSLAVKTKSFKDLYTGPVYARRGLGTEDCPGYCLGEFTMDRCDARCEYAYIRELLQIINQWPKNKNAA